MACRPFILKNLWFLFWVLIVVLSTAAEGPSEEGVIEKRIQIGMRLIGHEILISLGDCESRVLPVEKIDKQYKISFDAEFGFDPDTIIAVVGRVMASSKMANNYFVEVRQCDSEMMVHGFEIRDARYSGMIPCGGRILPKDCYYLNITILDGLPSPYAKPLPASPNRSSLAYWLVAIIALLGGMTYFMKRKPIRQAEGPPAPADPNLVLIGASQFDKRSGMLTFNDKSVELSNKETELLALLHSSANTPIAREIILQRVWGDEGDYVGRTLDVFISKLRKKLEADTSVKIVNIRGLGYKLVMNVSQ